MKRHHLLWLALLATLALVATACGGGEEESGQPAADKTLSGTTITFSTVLAEAEVAAVREVLGKFEAQTGAKVKHTQVTSADLPQKLQVEVKSGQHTIDLFAQDNLALKVLVDRKLVEDLSAVQIPAGVKQELLPEKFDGKQYFLPYRPNVRVAYTNNGKFQEAGVQPPTTVEELTSVAQKLKQAAGGTPKVTLSLAQGDPAAVTISEWIVSYGGNPLIVNDQGSVQAFTTLQQLWQQQLLAKESLQAKFDTEVNYLQGQTSWLAQNWPFTSSSLNDQGLLEEFSVYEGWAGPARAAHVIGGEVLGIPKGVSGKQKEAAIAFANFLMSKEAQEIFVAKNGWPSVRDDAAAQVPEELKTTFDAIQKALTDGWYRPNVAYWSDASDAMNAAIQRIMVKNEPVQSTLDSLHRDIEAAAKKKGAQYPPSS
jgi:trehalose transport system substrate-binding protein